MIKIIARTRNGTWHAILSKPIFQHTSLSKYSYTRTSISNWSTCDYDRYSNEVTPRWWWQLRNLKSRFRSFVIVRLPSTDSLCRYPPKQRIKMAHSRISSITLTSKGLDHNLYRGTSDFISCIPFSCGCNFIQCLLHHLSCHWNNASTRGVKQKSGTRYDSVINQ